VSVIQDYAAPARPATRFAPRLRERTIRRAYRWPGRRREGRGHRDRRGGCVRQDRLAFCPVTPHARMYGRGNRAFVGCRARTSCRGVRYVAGQPGGPPATRPSGGPNDAESGIESREHDGRRASSQTRQWRGRGHSAHENRGLSRAVAGGRLDVPWRAWGTWPAGSGRD
jgi:hypothetical protein